MKMIIKTLAVTFLFSVLIVPAFSIECQKVAEYKGGIRFDCQIDNSENAKVFHVLKLKGSFQNITKYQGYLMADETINGISEGVLNRINGGADSKMLRALLKCYSSRVKKSVSKEFYQAVRNSYRGQREYYQTINKKMPISIDEVMTVGTSIELGNIFDGIFEKYEQNSKKTAFEIVKACGLKIAVSPLKKMLKSLRGVGRKMKMGCLGFTVPARLSSVGLIHARNLDADFVRHWNKSPVIYLIEETGYYKYVSAGTAGLVYPGGISGMNEKGISVSLHQLSTTRYRSKIKNRNGYLAPFLQQRILREASSIDDAVKIVKTAGRFSSWTILVSDSKTGEVASIEFSGKRVAVSRRVKDTPVGQANHFLAPSMKKHFFYYSFAKMLETHSRLKVIEDKMSRIRTPVGVDWAIENLAGHDDLFAGFRSFGRTAVKAYNVMSTIALPEINEFWATIGDRTPAVHGNFIGFKIDWNEFTITPKDYKRVTKFDHIPNWEESLAYYVDAKEYADRGKVHQAINSLVTAQILAEKDGIYEIPYHYMEARMLARQKKYGQAHQKFMEIIRRGDDQLKVDLRMRVFYFAVLTREHGIRKKQIWNDPRWPDKREELLNEAYVQFFDLKGEFNHKWLRKQGRQIKALIDKSYLPSFPKAEYVTVD